MRTMTARYLVVPGVVIIALGFFIAGWKVGTSRTPASASGSGKFDYCMRLAKEAGLLAEATDAVLKATADRKITVTPRQQYGISSGLYHAHSSMMGNLPLPEPDRKQFAMAYQARLDELAAGLPPCLEKSEPTYFFPLLFMAPGGYHELFELRHRLQQISTTIPQRLASERWGRGAP